MRDAANTRDIIESRFKDRLDLYRPSVAEAIAGLFNTVLANQFDFKQAYKEAENKRLGLPYSAAMVEQLERIRERLLTVDERAKRYQASKDQEDYYSFYPYAFKRAIQEITAIKRVNDILVADYLADEAEDDRAALINELQRLEQLAAIADQEKRERVAEILTETVFNNLKNDYYLNGKVNENTELWQATKKAMHKDHSSALKGVISFLDYGQAIQELTRIQKRAQINELQNNLKYYADLQAFSKSEEAGKKNLTQAILGRLQQVFSGNGAITAGERDMMLNAVAKEFKGAKAKKTVEDTFRGFFIQSEPKAVKVGGKTIKVSTYNVIDLQKVAAHHAFELSEVEAMYKRRYYNLILRG